MRRLRSIASMLFGLLAAASIFTPLLLAQKDKPEPLTEAQVEEIREAGIDPNGRVSLYTKYVNERADTIKSLTNRSKSLTRAKRIDGELQDLTALMDEFGSNLDVYSDRHADIRKALKALTEATDRWLGILRALAGEPSFDLARKEAIESGQDLADEAKRLLTEQTEYFKLHKDEQGQDRAEPK
jgi:maltooligosyltrehalose synthase